MNSRRKKLLCPRTNKKNEASTQLYGGVTGIVEPQLMD